MRPAGQVELVNSRGALMATATPRCAFAVSIVTASLALTAPAGAHFAAGRSAFDQHPGPELVQFRDFFGGDREWSYPNNSYDPFWGGRRYPNRYYDPDNPFYRRPQVYESVKPPPPRKVETPPTATVVVIGDSLGEWLAYGLEQAFAETPEIGVVRKIRPDLGLARDDARLETPQWSQVIKDLLAAEKPSAIVVMLGVSDRVSLHERIPATDKTTTPPDNQRPAAAAGRAQYQPPGGNYEFRTDKWAELYSKRIDDMIAALKAKGVPILWVGLPAIRGAKSTSDMSYLDELYRARAEKAGIIYVDVWGSFVDDQGQYAVQGPDFEGQTRRLRTYDGVYFTKAGAEKLGHYVERDLRRVLSSHVLPVALPGPEESSPAKGAIGPVVPLDAIGAGESGDLLGREGEANPLATRLQSRGTAIAVPPGRADDFSWPRADANSSGAVDLGPTPGTPVPAMPPAAGKNDAKQKYGNKNGAIKTKIKVERR
jgi:uncharacterized protein